MKESRYFSLYLPEYKDDIDISEISDNFNRLDSGLEAMLIKKDITTNTINDISVFPPFWSVKNPHDFDVVIYDRIFEKEITVEAGKTYKAQVDHGTKLNIHVQGLHELEFTYYISTEQAIEAAKGSDYKLTQIASEEFSASYKLQVKPKGSEEYIDVPASAVINIPKDKVVKSGDVKTCQTDGVPEGFKKGDKYIDLVIDNDEGSHIYIPVNALVDNKAEGISYSNTTSKMKATNVQSAIDEVVTKIGALDTNKLDKTAVLNVWSEDEKSTEKTLSEKFIYDNLTTKHDFDIVEKNVEVLNGVAEGQFVTDSAATSVKVIPENAVKGIVSMIGGKTVKQDDVLLNAPVKKVVLTDTNENKTTLLLDKIVDNLPDYGVEGNYLDFSEMIYHHVNKIKDDGSDIEALTTPELIPLTDLLLPFKCEPGGTVTFENEHNLDVPNTIIYEKEMN